MKVKKLTLANFRGFDQIDIEFGDLTVIAGVNGSGKSGILSAIAGLLSYAAPEISDSREPRISFNDDDVKHGESGFSASCNLEGTIMNFSVQVARAITPVNELPGIQAELEELKTKRRFVEEGSEEDTGFDDRIRQLEKKLKPAEDHISSQPYQRVSNKEPHFDDPLFIFYKPDRNFTKLTRRSNLTVAEGLPKPSLAHKNSLRGERVNLNDFLVWFGLSEKGALGEGYKAENLRDALKGVIKTILPEVGEVRLVTPDARALPFFLVSKYQDNKLLGSFKIEQLSDGERMLLGLAFDLTRRLTLANPELSDPVADGSAIVLIDEIELHLHPTWQRKILRRLIDAFKNCQFIVTTHSPMILSEVDANDIRFLYRDSESGKMSFYIPHQALGLDANQMLDEMGANDRNEEVEKSLNKLFKLIDNEKFDEARKALEPLVMLLGELDPEITRAKSLITFLEDE